jgi:cytoskeletal protein CcmA (bactofilin family)
VRVDGHFVGRIYTEDLLEIGAEGVLEGEADLARAVVAGRIEGKVRVREHLVVEPGGHIVGTLDATVVELRPGARIDATVRITGADSD